MAEWPSGQDDEGWPEPDAPDGEEIEEIEGTVVPFPRPAGQPAPAPRKAGPGQRGELRRIIPEHLTTVAGIRKALRWRWRRARHISLYHLVRVPKRVPLALWWAAAGVLRVEVAFHAWAFVTEQAYLRGQTIEAGDIRTYLQVHKEGKQTRLFRVPAMIAAHVLVLVLAAVVTVKLPVLWVPIGLAAVPFLAAAGRPDDRPIVDSAVIPTSFEPLTEMALIRALGGLGIGELNRGLREDPEHAVVPIAPDHPGRQRVARAVRPAARRHRRGGLRAARAAGLRAAPPAGLRVARDDAQAAPGRAEPVRRRRGHDRGRPRALAAGQARRRRPVQAAPCSPPTRAAARSPSRSCSPP